MAVKAGDFLLVNFTLKVKESGETVDTTYDAVAKDTHLHREDSTYGPRFIILGGRTLIYDVSIEKIVEDDNEKILNIISKRIPEVDKAKFGVERTRKELTVDVPEEAFYLSGLQVAKKSVTSDLQKFFPDIDTISFREVFKRRAPETEMEEAPKASAVETSKSAEQVETKQETEKPQEAPAQPARKRRAPAKKPASKRPTKRAMMGSESQR